MADLLVSPIVESVVERVTSYLNEEYKLYSDVNKKLKDVKKALEKIQSVAGAADEVEIKKYNNLKPWLREVKEAAYEAEDVVDEFEYLRLERQLEASEDDGSQRDMMTKVSSIFMSCYRSAKRFTRNRESLKKLRNIEETLRKLADRTADFLNLLNTVEGQPKEGDDRTRETSSVVHEPLFVGREVELEEIVNQLVVVGDGSSSSGSFREVAMVPIVGLGGFGKTTLARYVYNHPRVEKHFEKRIWVHVGQNFDVKRLTIEMIHSASGQSDPADNLDTLQQKLKRILGSKRFLLVLDDMWCGEDKSKNEQDWRVLCAPLAAVERGDQGSKILVTSRTQEVAGLPGALSPHFLAGLLEDECWSIIKARTFRDGIIPDGCRDLVEIGKKIAVKVRGSPLAAEAVGGILRDKRDERSWSRILNTDLGGELPSVMQVLKLSYQHLPPHLRKCFGFCSLFPKGYGFSPDYDLVFKWVALGFIRPGRGETMEETGRGYFDDLVSRSFFQLHPDSDPYKIEKLYVMHDLMNDLARDVSRGDCLRFDGDDLSEEINNIPATVRHVSISGSADLAQLIKGGCNFKKLRTLIFRVDESYSDFVRTKILRKPTFLALRFKKVLGQLQCIRLLHLECPTVIELPDAPAVFGFLRDWYWKASRVAMQSLPSATVVG